MEDEITAGVSPSGRRHALISTPQSPDLRVAVCRVRWGEQPVPDQPEQP